jgi:PAS domain S-box-containing protein
MTLNEFLALFVRATFLLLALLALVEWLRHRDRTRLNVAAMFGSLAVAILASQLRERAHLEIPGLRTLGAMAVVMQPYLLLRLVRESRPISPLVQRLGLAGLAISWIVLVFNPPPLTPLLTLIVVTYFVYIEGYAAVALVRGALATDGVTHWRLTLAAAGSGLLASTILLSGATTALPSLAGLTEPLSQLMATLAALSYYLGFAPPRWLRRAWQLVELYHFMHDATGHKVTEDAPEVLEHLCQAANQSMGALLTVAAFWDDTEKCLKVRAFHGIDLGVDVSFSVNGGAMGQAWHTHQPALARAPAGFGSAEADRIATAIGAGALLAVPIITTRHVQGLLLVFLQNSPLFASDDLALLALFAEQSATILDHIALLAEQRSLAEQFRQSEARFRNLVEGAPDAIVGVDAKGRIVLVNEQAERMFDYRPDEMVGNRIESLIPERFHKVHVQHQISYIREPRTRPMGAGLDLYGRRRDGAEFPVEISLSPLETEEGLLVTAIIRDVTERKRAEEELHQHREYLEERVAERTAELALTNERLA